MLTMWSMVPYRAHEGVLLDMVGCYYSCVWVSVVSGRVWCLLTVLMSRMTMKSRSCTRNMFRRNNPSGNCHGDDGDAAVAAGGGVVVIAVVGGGGGKGVNEEEEEEDGGGDSISDAFLPPPPTSSCFISSFSSSFSSSSSSSPPSLSS